MKGSIRKRLSELRISNTECNIVSLISFADGVNGTYQKKGRNRINLKNTYEIKVIYRFLNKIRFCHLWHQGIVYGWYVYHLGAMPYTYFFVEFVALQPAEACRRVHGEGEH